MKNNRFLEIDLLRGIAMLAMILIHTCYYFLSDPTALFIWNWSQFAVPVFIFCSAYLFFQKPKDLSLEYVRKRIGRLLYPYYIFLLFFIPIYFLINPDTSQIKYIFQSIFVIGGVDINWLVLLFIQFTIIFPLFFSMHNQNKILFYIYSVIAFVSSCLFIFYKLPFNQKFLMWLPWSVIPIFTLYFVNNHNKKSFMRIMAIISTLLFFTSYYLEVLTNHKLGMYENKYPPTIYFLSYGILMTILLYLLSKLIMKSKLLTSFFAFLSVYSYPMYFIHYTILIVLATQVRFFTHWSIFFLTILTVTIAIQVGINKFKN
jgi:peptidoglycan/LPS O-acetylase OafA/YrhL